MNGTTSTALHTKTPRRCEGVSAVKRVPVDRNQQTWASLSTAPRTAPALAVTDPGLRSQWVTPPRVYPQPAMATSSSMLESNPFFSAPRSVHYHDYNEISPGASLRSGFAVGYDYEGSDEDGAAKAITPTSVASMLKRFQPGHSQAAKQDIHHQMWGTNLTSPIHGRFTDQVQLSGSLWSKEAAHWKMLHGILILDKMQTTLRLELFRDERDSRLVRSHDLTRLVVREGNICETDGTPVFSFEMVEPIEPHPTYDVVVCSLGQASASDRTRWMDAIRGSLSLTASSSNSQNSHEKTQLSARILRNSQSDGILNKEYHKADDVHDHVLSLVQHIDTTGSSGVAISDQPHKEFPSTESVADGIIQMVKLIELLDTKVESSYASLDKTMTTLQKETSLGAFQSLNSRDLLDGIQSEFSLNNSLLTSQIGNMTAASELVLANIETAQSQLSVATNLFIDDTKKSTSIMTSALEKRLEDLHEQQKMVSQALGKITTVATEQESGKINLDTRLQEISEAVNKLSRETQTAVDSLSVSIKENKSDVSKILLEMNSRSGSLAVGRAANTNLTFSSDVMVDRPTKSLMISMNEKLIQLHKLYEHAQQSTLSRFSSLEERLTRSHVFSQAERADPLGSTYHIEQTIKEIKNDVLESTERLSRMSREQSGHVSSTASSLYQILQQIQELSVGSPNKLSGSGKFEGASSDRALCASVSAMEAKLAQIQANLKTDCEGTTGQLNQLITMFSIQQEMISKLKDDMNGIKVGSDVAYGLKGAGKTHSVPDEISQALKSMDERIGTLTKAIQGSQGAGIETTNTTGVAESTKNTSNMLQSIHTTLVNYLPLNLEQKLAIIETSVADLIQYRKSSLENDSRGCVRGQWQQMPLTEAQVSPSGSQHISSHMLMEWQQDIMSRNNLILQSLDAMQQSLSRVVETVCVKSACACGHASNGNTNVLKVVPMDSDADVRSLLLEIKEIAIKATANGAGKPAMEVSKANELAKAEREELAMQVKKLERQKQILNAEIIVLRGTRRQ
ncbi:hypothetical protein BSLG_009312 [Batrachochytrium salamandrivorans]|nr:hypothetical protein BSLG_009312 [Batrachochytrium salamandrivorans]